MTDMLGAPRRPAIAALLLATLACPAACKKGGAAAEADASTATLSAGELCDAVFGAASRQLEARCSPEDQQKKQHGYLTGLASGAVLRCKEELDPLVARATVRIDAEAARRCGKVLEETSWKQTLASLDVSRFPECRGLVLGKMTEEQPCESGVECAGGLTCVRGDGSQGRCEKPGKGAAACSRSVPQILGASSCGPGAYCPVASRPSTLLGAAADEPVPPPTSASAAADAEARASDVAAARKQALRDAAEFGLIGLLGLSPAGAGIDAVDPPEGIGLGGGLGLGQGRPGSSRAKPPKVRVGATAVSGRLPPEVIQRIVRQNFGRFRLCYENGLRNNPRLAGRASVKFVIGRDGAVKNVADAGSDLPDAGVIACITRAFWGLSFPQPEGGIVTVTYPLVFSPGDEADAGAAPSAPAPSAPAPEAPPPAAPPVPTAAPAPDGEQATCVPVLAQGQDCQARNACADGLACRIHQCSAAPPAGPGGACMEEDDCRPDLYCSHPQGVFGSRRGACAARKPEGAACSSSLQCGGICLAGKCAAFCGAR